MKTEIDGMDYKRKCDNERFKNLPAIGSPASSIMPIETPYGETFVFRNIRMLDFVTLCPYFYNFEKNCGFLDTKGITYLSQFMVAEFAIFCVKILGSAKDKGKPASGIYEKKFNKTGFYGKNLETVITMIDPSECEDPSFRRLGKIIGVMADPTGKCYYFAIGVSEIPAQ